MRVRGGAPRLQKRRRPVQPSMPTPPLAQSPSSAPLTQTQSPTEHLPCPSLHVSPRQSPKRRNSHRGRALPTQVACSRPACACVKEPRPNGWQPHDRNPTPCPAFCGLHAASATPCRSMAQQAPYHRRATCRLVSRVARIILTAPPMPVRAPTTPEYVADKSVGVDQQRTCSLAQTADERLFASARGE